MTWEEIKASVEKNGNIRTFQMGTLRDAAGREKLGSRVAAEISKTLAGFGLGHVPVDLPLYQTENVRLYKRGTSVGDFIENILSPSEKNDQIIIERLGESDISFQEIVEKIREIISE